MNAGIAPVRRQVGDLHQEPVRYGLVDRTAGDVSARVPGEDLLVIKPSGVSCCVLTAMDDEFGAEIPVGPIAPVTGTPFDLREAAVIGERVVDADPRIGRAGGGFDHNWVLDGNGLRRAAVLSHPAGGRRVECLTREPGLQVCTGNHFDGSLTGRSGRPYRAYAGIALETRHFPDSPNRPEYPSTVLRPGEEFRSTTVTASRRSSRDFAD